VKRSRSTLAVALLLTACSTPLASSSTLPLTSATPSAAATPSASTGQPPATGWSRLGSGVGPLPRSDHTLTVDDVGSTAYLFGGQAANGSPLGDLWALDLASDTWRRVDASGPAPRFGHSATWLSGTGLVVLAGQGEAFYNDVWTFDPRSARWRQLRASGDAPVPRYGSCAAIGPDGRLWISHGFTSEGSRFADTRAYDFDTHAWTDETPAGERPIERCLHGCWWTDDDRLALYGGQTTGTPALGDLWHLSQGPRPGTNAWSEARVPGTLRPRQLYASARWADGTIVFGGGSLDAGYLADAWQIPDAGRINRIDVAHGPTARSGAELIADPRRNRLLLFGGRDAEGPDAELWQLILPGG